MNTITPELQLLNFLEAFGHKHGAAVLRKELGIDNPATENRPSLKPQSLARFYGRPGYDQEEECKNPGYCAENWEWPEGDSHGTKLAAEIREAGNKMTAQEREEALAHGMRLIHGDTRDEEWELCTTGLWTYRRRKPPTQHRFIKSDGTPIYPLPKKRGALRIFFSCLAVVLSAWCFAGTMACGLYAEGWAGYFFNAAGMTMWAVCAIDFWRDTAGQPLFLKPRKGGAK